MDILWRVFRILTEPVPYKFVSVNYGMKPGPTLQRNLACVCGLENIGMLSQSVTQCTHCKNLLMLLFLPKKLCCIENSHRLDGLPRVV